MSGKMSTTLEHGMDQIYVYCLLKTSVEAVAPTE